MEFTSNKKGNERLSDYNKWKYKYNIDGFKDNRIFYSKIRHELEKFYREISPESFLSIVRDKYNI